MELHKWQGAAWNCFSWSYVCVGLWYAPSLLFCLTFEPSTESHLVVLSHWRGDVPHCYGKIQDSLLRKMWLFMMMVEDLWQKPYYVLWVIFRCMFLSLQRQDLRGSWQDLSSPQASWKQQNILLPDAFWGGSCQEQEELKEFSNFKIFCPWNKLWNKKS